MDDASHRTQNSSVAQQFDVIVLGAGISGLVAASILSAEGCKVLVVDEYDHVGGNHINWTSNEGYTFDIGSLIFQDDSPLLRHFPELLPHYVPITPSWGRLNPQGVITAYPISVREDILGAGPIGLTRIFASVLYARLFKRSMSNAKDFARFWIGSYLLHRSGLETYMKRFYGVEAEEIDIDLARKRMLWISEYASVLNLVKRAFMKRRSAGPKNRQMARPREGFDALYLAAVKRLERSGVTFKLSAAMQRLDKSQDGFRLHMADSTAIAGRVVSTIPIPRTESLWGIASLQKLHTITLISLYFSFSGERGFDQSIIYNFSHDGAWKRLTVYSDFYGKVREREYFAVEVIANHVASPAQAEANFRRHVLANGMFKGDLKLEGSQVLESAYPIYSKGAATNAAAAIARLQALGVESIGRQGAFNYQPTARVSTIDVEVAMASRSSALEFNSRVR
ncbi:NAD(P)-binding protein [Rhizobium sp. Root1220]|uniref:FAD-dependent oxidoreductase n=1 Tax=Rhizobium sp. Root1220 TaxID=1736432 RepID=UPI0006F378B9|nr:NAD(P)-binding protein [Rhizobium sp. Root1220]KQV70336.1 FAD-binding protein [Rhizobium sp. Root1220]